MSSPALAAVRFARPAAPGWDAAPQDQAIARANDWASADGVEVKQVYSTAAVDDYAETLALLELDGPLRSEAAEAPAPTLSAVVAPLLGVVTPPQESSVVAKTTGGVIVRGRWSNGGILYQVALASAGPKRALLVFCVKESEASLYAPIFDRAVATLEGVAASVSPFPMNTWRLGGALVWLMFAILTWRIVAARSAETSPMYMGRAVAAVSIVAAALAVGIVYALLTDRELELALRGLSREWVVVEMALLGVAVALVAMTVGAVATGRQRRIRSAPADGTFSAITTKPTTTLHRGIVAEVATEDAQDPPQNSH